MPKAECLEDISATERERLELMAKEAYATMLEDLAAKIRTGKLEVTHVEQNYPADRRWVKGEFGDADGRWEFFRTQDLTLTLKYRDPEFQAKERARIAGYPSEGEQ